MSETATSLFCVLFLGLFSLRFAAASHSSGLSESKHDFYYTKLKVGSDEQSLKVLLDTTNSGSFLFGSHADLSDKQDAFDTDKSDSYSPVAQSWHFSYHNLSANGTEMGRDTLQVFGYDFGTQQFGMDERNERMLKTEQLSGAVGFNRRSNLMTNLSHLTIHADENKVYYGDYHTKTKNKSNISVQTTNTDISDMWSFNLDSITAKDVTIVTSNLYAVIDLASPFLTFAMTESDFDTYIWDNIGGDGNCDRETHKCKKSDEVVDWISFKRLNDTWVVGKNEYYHNKKLWIKWKRPYTGSNVVFFGRPFLDTTIVNLYTKSNTVGIWYRKSGSDMNHTAKNVIIAISVVAAVAILFFGYMLWNIGLPQARALNPPQTNESQVATNPSSNPLGLLRGQGLDPPGHAQGFQADAASAPASSAAASGGRVGGQHARNEADMRAQRLAALERRQEEEEEAPDFV